jgi:hypothetical protein
LYKPLFLFFCFSFFALLIWCFACKTFPAVQLALFFHLSKCKLHLRVVGNSSVGNQTSC